jgi:hypothetical protein
MFRFDRLQLENFRCFEHLDLPIEKDLRARELMEWDRKVLSVGP